MEGVVDWFLVGEDYEIFIVWVKKIVERDSVYWMVLDGAVSVSFDSLKRGV